MNKVKLKKLMKVTCGVFLTLALAACSTQPATVSTDGTENTQQSAVDVVEIRFQWWGDTLRHDIYNAIADLFEAENPDVRIFREPASWGDYWTRLATQSAGGNAPTVLSMHPQFVSDYALRGVLMDLETFVEDNTIDSSHIAPAVLDGVRVNGELTGIPKGITFQAFGVNRTLFENFGIELPANTDDWTWDEFMDMAKEFTDAKGSEDLYFIADHSTEWVYFRWVARQAGGDIYSDDATKLGFTEDVLVDWFNMWNELRDMGAVPDAATTVEEGQLPWQQRRFPAGKTAISAFPANQLLMQQTQIGDDALIDMIRVPMSENETKRAENLELPMLSIAATATADEAEAAARFINFFVNRTESLEIFLMEQGVPANSEMIEHISDKLEPASVRTVEFVESMLDITGAGVYPPNGAQEIDALFKNLSEQVMWGQLTPEKAAEDFMTGAAAVLEANQ
jgi:ABC-type sugar transport system, periplasmic component